MAVSQLCSPLYSCRAIWVVCSCCWLTKSCPTLCDPMNCNLPGSCVHGIFQARRLEWVVISFSKGSSHPEDWTHIGCIDRCCFVFVFVFLPLSHQGTHLSCLLIEIFNHNSPEYPKFKTIQVHDITQSTSYQYSCLENPMDGGAWWAAVHGVAKSRIRLSDLTFTFHFPALEKEMATHSSVLA